MHLLQPFRRPAHAVPAVPVKAPSLRLVRRFVETGDERCPVAGIWSRLQTDNAAPDEAELTQPAPWRLLLGWAFTSPLSACSAA